MYRARNSNADIFGVIDAESCFGVWLCRVHLIKFFVVALLKIDDRPVARPADLDHREAVGGRISKCHHAVEKAWGGHRETDARLPGQIAGDRSRISGGLFMPKADVPQPFGLRETSQIRDRNTRHAEDSIDSIEFQGIDHKMKPVGDGGRIHFVWHVKHRSLTNPGPVRATTMPQPRSRPMAWRAGHLARSLRRSCHSASWRFVLRCNLASSAPGRYARPTTERR